MKTFRIDDILKRLKQALNLNTDVELATTLGIKKATLSNWRARNSIDFFIVFSVCEHINIDWLIMDRGNSQITTNESVNIPNPQLFDKVIEQAKEIGQLQERIKQLEQRLEKTAGDVSTGDIANVG